MPSIPKVQEKIAEIISRPHNVTFDEIKWVMDKLGASERGKHGRLFSLNHHRIMINEHNNGKNTVQNLGR